MGPDTTHEYIREILALKDKYVGAIEVYLGIEQDYFTDEKPEGFDYVIGTAHHVQKDGQFVTIDAGEKNQKHMVGRYFGGDYYSMAEAYFQTIAKIVGKTGADIIGHFDLIAKYNSDGSHFDETHPRYVAAALGAMDTILKSCKLFEVNTGAMYRFNNLEPYPSVFLLKELCIRGGEVILSSDSHDSESLCHKFGEMLELLKTCGFKSIKRLTKNGFIDAKL
jgi:histidinol-phosphatase (PHP family)